MQIESNLNKFPIILEVEINRGEEKPTLGKIITQSTNNISSVRSSKWIRIEAPVNPVGPSENIIVKIINEYY